MEWWFILKPLIEAFIQMCEDNRSLDEIETGMASPGVVEEAAMNQILHEAGVRGKRRKRMVRRGMRRLQRASRQEVREFMKVRHQRAED